jgi:dehydrogenase/reductase SDR family member 7B
MKNFFRNKTVLITGASSGIGRALALQLAVLEAEIILTSENEKELTEVAELCKQKGGKVYTLVMDQSDDQSIDLGLELLFHYTTKIDVVILNAGISQRSTVHDTLPSVHQKIMQINFESNVQIIRKILPFMLENGGGHIGVTSSISGKFGFHLRSSYAASKHALHGFFETLGLEYRPKHIFVTIVCPGRVTTNISYHALHGDGKSHGKLDEGQSGGISPEKCAKIYLRAISRKRREKLIGGKELIMVYLKRFFPGIFYRIAQKIKPL